MKKILFIFLSLIMVLCIGCSKDRKPALNNTPYTPEMAIKNGDVVGNGIGKSHIEKLEKFIENIKNESADKIRITQYSVEGAAILTDLEYDGKTINYTNDTTRDRHGARTIEKKIYDNIYKEGSSYHLKNSTEDIVIYLIN